MTAVTHPAYPPRRTSARARTWWGRAWVRAVEESAYAEADLRGARTLSRSGLVGGLTVDRGSVVAAVREGDDAWSVEVTVPVLDDASWAAFTELVAAESGRIAALLAGDLPHQLVEHAEESGVELLPYGGELGATCSCEAWMQPCHHALAVMYQLSWLLDEDPMSLLLVRGMPRDDLLAALWSLQETGTTVDEQLEVDLDVALDAVQRATRMVELLESADGIDDLLQDR
jgi:uncharacterized Zn finger protein